MSCLSWIRSWNLPNAHVCHAMGCKVVVDPALLMCKKHWRMVPKRIAQEVWRHYRPGQEIDKRPTEAFLAAAQSAINAVARKEGLLNAR